VEGLSISEINVTDAAILCAYAQRVTIVPGYGLAVAQAQHTCHEFESARSKRSGSEFCYSPVAGRMPSRTNVLLVEADVPYDKLKKWMTSIHNCPTRMLSLSLELMTLLILLQTDPSSPIYGILSSRLTQPRM
jgi:NAD(P) transhydrogenase subunit beta